jgi:hypothetical protein
MWDASSTTTSAALVIRSVAQYLETSGWSLHALQNLRFRPTPVTIGLWDHFGDTGHFEGMSAHYEPATN